MRDQEIVGLYDAYLQVHSQPHEVEQLDEDFPKQVGDFLKSGGDKIRKRLPGVAAVLSPVGSGRNTPTATSGGYRPVVKDIKKEETDLFDYILEYLVAEGYADTNENALVIMSNMSEEWRNSIVEQNVSRMGNPVTDALPWNRNTKYTTQGTVRKPGENVQGQQTGVKSNTVTSTMGGPRPAGSKLGTTTPRVSGGGKLQSTTVQQRKPLVSTSKPGPSNNFGRGF